METNRVLSEEQIATYKGAGLSDKQIQLLHTPFANISPGESQLAIQARDKLDSYKNRIAKQAKNA